MMKKILNILLVILLVMAIDSCSNEEILPDSKTQQYDDPHPLPDPVTS